MPFPFVEGIYFCGQMAAARMALARKNSVTTLYRVIDDGELNALRALGFRKFPACGEAAFYPMLSRHFALESLRQRPPGRQYLTQFKICAVYARSFEVQTLCGEVHDELWVPAEELPVFNEKIVGKISLWQL